MSSSASLPTVESLTAVTVRQPGVDYDSLVDSLVRIDGNAAPLFNQRRQMVGVHLFFPTLRQVTVIQPAPRDPFAVPAVPVADLFRFSPDPGLSPPRSRAGHGHARLAGTIAVHSGRQGRHLHADHAAEPASLSGSLVDVVGFPAVDLFKPSLEDAMFRAAAGAGCASASHGHHARSGCPERARRPAVCGWMPS